MINKISIGKISALIFTMLFLFIFNTNAQTKIKLPEGLCFNLPKDWKNDEIKTIGKSKAYTYSQKEFKIEDKTIVPRILIVIESLDSAVNLAQYTIQKRIDFSFSTDEVYFESDVNYPLKIDNTIAYKAYYTDKSMITHRLLIIHSVQNKMGIQFIIDIDEIGYAMTEMELWKIFQSVKMK